jgi:hypothetical protein
MYERIATSVVAFVDVIPSTVECAGSIGAPRCYQISRWVPRSQCAATDIGKEPHAPGKEPESPEQERRADDHSEHHPKGGRVQFKMSYSAVEQRVRHHDHHHEWQEQN